MNSAQVENPYDFYFGNTDAAPVGKVALTDYSRYQNAATDQLFQQLSTSAPGSAEATSSLDQLETVMVKQVPIIPMFVNSQQGIFNSRVATGFPTSSDPYAFPSEIDTELVVFHLKPAGTERWLDGGEPTTGPNDFRPVLGYRVSLALQGSRSSAGYRSAVWSRSLSFQTGWPGGGNPNSSNWRGVEPSTNFVQSGPVERDCCWS